MNEPGQRNMYG
jgi:hypothetical protein